METCHVGKSYPAPKDWENHNSQRLTDLLKASVELEQEKLILENMREAVRKQEAKVQAIRDKQYTFRIIK